MNKKQSQKGSSHLILIIVLMVALLGALGYIFWQNFMQSKTNTSVTTSNNTSSDAVTKTTVTNELDMPDLGIKIINIPESLVGLYYHDYFNTLKDTDGIRVVGFGTMQLDKESANTCTPSNNDQSIGALRRKDGVFDNKRGLQSELFIKQFADFFVTYSHPQDACYLDNATGIDAISVKALFDYQMSVFQTLVTNPDNIVSR